MTLDYQPNDDASKPTDAQRRALDDELRDLKAMIARQPLGEVDMDGIRNRAVRQVWWQRAGGVTFVLAGALVLVNALVLRGWPNYFLQFSIIGAIFVAFGLMQWSKGDRLARECDIAPETIRAARRKQLVKLVPFVVVATLLGLLAAYLARG